MPVGYFRPLDDAIAAIPASFHWVALTSADAVKIFRRRWTNAGKTPADLHGVKVAAVGPATAHALAEWGAQPDFVPNDFVGDALAEGLPSFR